MKCDNQKPRCSQCLQIPKDCIYQYKLNVVPNGGISIDSGTFDMRPMVPGSSKYEAILLSRSLLTWVVAFCSEPACEPISVYKDMHLSVVRCFLQHQNALFRYQKFAIDKGSVYDVPVPTRVHIVGWPNDRKMVLAQIILPPTKPELVPYSLICSVGKGGLIVAGLAVISTRACLQIDQSKRWIDLSSLGPGYQTLCDRCDFTKLLWEELLTQTDSTKSNLCISKKLRVVPTMYD